MDWTSNTKAVGFLLFFGVPIALWLIGIMAVRRRGFEARAFAFVAGGDNRLSLSRLQAFLWTLVIFGSFAAAMGIHNRIIPITTAAAKDEAAVKKAAADKAAQVQKDALTARDVALDLSDKAQKAAITAGIQAEAAAATAAAATATAQEKTDAADKAKSKAAADKNAADLTKIAEEKKKAYDEATAKRIAADKAASVGGQEWVKIPVTLLALAGIAIGSGVFSSLISSVSDEEKTACVTGVQSKPLATYLAEVAAALRAEADRLKADPNATAQAKSDTETKAAEATKAAEEEATQKPSRYCLIISGLDMKKSGRVRFGSRVATIRDWNDPGTQIVVDLPPGAPKKLIVDTAKGKLCHSLQGEYPGFTLGEAIFYYEFVDLFRDDKSPASFDLMKFQMFGWTIIAIFIYSYLFLNDLHDHIEILPEVPASIVALTGLSQAGYLTSKGVSSMTKPSG
jgi:hypothetical protein